MAPAHILLPGENIPLEKWGCVACDQFTSDRAYWEQARRRCGRLPQHPAAHPAGSLPRG
ncbi:MAG: hypothetical protein ACLVJH_10625 [Faecalibacterium prausnitzii]